MPNLRITKLYTAEQIRNSPSRGDGISESLENDYRRTTCLFIKAAGKELELHVDAIATALVFFHKFFMLHSFQRHDRVFVGSACLFLAAKVEESSKRVEVVMSKCWKVWHGGRDPPPEHEKAFKKLREKILIAERCVLHTLGFQLTVEHPYTRVMYLLRKLFNLGKGADRGRGADKTLNRQLSQAAHSFVNDSLLTTVCLQYRPAQVAAAVVYLSYLYMGLPRVDMALLETDIAVVADICDTILSLYDEQGPGHATAVVSNIRNTLNQRIKGGDTPAGSTAGSPPSVAPSPRPSPSPRPTPYPSPRTTADPGSSSSPSPSLARPAGAGAVDGASSSNGTAAADAGAGGGSSGRGAGAARSEIRDSGSGAGRGRGAVGTAWRETSRPAEEGRGHNYHHERNPRNSPSRTGGAGKSSSKRKSGEGGTDFEGWGRERGYGGGAGSGGCETKRHKGSSFS